MGCVSQKQKKDFIFSTIPAKQQATENLEEWTKAVLKQTTWQSSHSGRPSLCKSKTMSSRLQAPLEQILEEE